jgi:uncharacterized Zn-finger protein
MSGIGKRKELEGQDMKKKHGCDECEKYFAFVSKLKSDSDLHMLTHTGEKPWVCETCDKHFSLKMHMRTHSGYAFWHAAYKPHVCETCDKAFSDSGDLAVHMRTHTEEEPHVCLTCDKEFSDSSSLDVHLRTHTGDRPRAWCGVWVCM